MKVVFLDVDGVINSLQFCEKNKDEMIDRQGVALLKKLIEQTGAVIVMSSGWRLWFGDNMEPQMGDSQYLYNILIEFGIELYDKTPDFSTEDIRTKRTFSHVKAKEISEWLKDKKNIESFIVLDDLDLKNEQINAHLVRIDGKIGITNDDVECAIKMLN